jgi:hypothetical protein
MSIPLPIPGPLSLGELLDRAFRLYRARFATMLLTAAVLVVPAGIVTGLLMGQSTLSLTRASEQLAFDAASGNELAMLGPTFSYFGLALLTSLLAGLAYGIAALALTAQSDAALHGEELALGAGLRRGLSRFWSWLGMSILKGLALFGIGVAVSIPMVILVMALAAIGSTGQGAGDGAGLVLAILCGYLVMIVLFLAPWLFLSARWAASVPALVIERLGATRSLRRSWTLTKRRAWRCFGFIFLLGLLSFLVASLPLVIVQQVALALLPPSAMPAILTASYALSAIFGALWYPLSLAAYVLLYYDLRVRAEDYDLALRVDALAETAAEPAAPVDVAEPLL